MEKLILSSLFHKYVDEEGNEFSGVYWGLEGPEGFVGLEQSHTEDRHSELLAVFRDEPFVEPSYDIIPDLRYFDLLQQNNGLTSNGETRRDYWVVHVKGGGQQNFDDAKTEDQARAILLREYKQAFGR